MTTTKRGLFYRGANCGADMFVCNSAYQSENAVLPHIINIKIPRRHRQTILAAILVGLMAGCVSVPKMEPVPLRTMMEFSCRMNSNGLEIAVDPYTDSDRVIRHFGMNLLSHKIIPFEVLFANREAKGGFLLQPESAIVVDERSLEKADSASPELIRASSSDPSRAIGLAVMLFPVPGLVFGLLVGDDYWDVQDVSRHMESVRFNDRPLYRSDSNRGFLYVKFADMGDVPKAAAVIFRVKDVRSGQEKTLIVPLKGR